MIVIIIIVKDMIYSGSGSAVIVMVNRDSLEKYFETVKDGNQVILSYLVFTVSWCQVIVVMMVMVPEGGNISNNNNLKGVFKSIHVWITIHYIFMVVLISANK